MKTLESFFSGSQFHRGAASKSAVLRVLFWVGVLGFFGYGYWAIPAIARFQFHTFPKWELLFDILICAISFVGVVAVLSRLYRFEGPLTTMQSPFRDSLTVHVNPLGHSTRIKSAAKEIRRKLPLWFSEGYKEIRVYSHLLGGRDDDKLKLTALKLAVLCDDAPDILVYRKAGLRTLIDHLLLRVSHRIKAEKLDGVIVFRKRQ